MAKILYSDSLPDLDISTQHWVYNALDCCVTHEIGNVLKSQLDSTTQITYNFSRGMQAPALELMLRGILVDDNWRHNLINKYTVQVRRLQLVLDRISIAVSGAGLNPASPKQLQYFFYEVMGLPKQFKNDKGVRKVSTNREALEALESYFYAGPIVRLILAIRDLNKKLSVLKSGVDPDGRMRASFNVCGTETGRWSSSKNILGTGMNLQNPADDMRRMFVADPGMKFAYIDLEQAESRAVAYISGDEAYIEACESGDLHTTVCQMVWPNLGWTGELKHDKNEIASQIFYRTYTYRDMSKRGGHGTNYFGKPWTMARHLKVKTEVMQLFQDAYFEAFSGIHDWHQQVAQQIQLNGFLTTFFGRRRYFFGRRNDDSTLREAIAFEPQSTVGDLLNLLLWRVWRYTRQFGVKIVSQLHDAILIQYPERDEQWIIPKVLDIMKVPVPVNGRQMLIPCEAAVGWNWSHYNDNPDKGVLNYDGVKTWTGEPDKRSRTQTEELSIMDRIIY